MSNVLLSLQFILTSDTPPVDIQCCGLFSAEDLPALCEEDIPQQNAEDTEQIYTRSWIPFEEAIPPAY